MGLAVLHWSGMLFSNISVSEVHISFTHTVKARKCTKLILVPQGRCARRRGQKEEIS